MASSEALMAAARIVEACEDEISSTLDVSKARSDCEVVNCQLEAVVEEAFATAERLHGVAADGMASAAAALKELAAKALAEEEDARKQSGPF